MPKLHALIENKKFSYGKLSRENLIIHGDNLLALKALEAEFSSKIKCCYIDPPYNTGNAFENYDDDLEHTIWLGQMRARLQLIRNLLRDDGFICVHIDDAEGPYLKMLLDEVFGRKSYLTTFYVQVRYAEKTLKQDMAFHKQIEQIHIYKKSRAAKPNQKMSENNIDKYITHVRELKVGRKIELGGKSVVIFKPGEYEIIRSDASVDGLKEIWASGTILDGNSSGRFFRDYLTYRKNIDGLGALYKVEGIGNDGLGFRYFSGPKRATAAKGKYFQGVPLEIKNNSSKKRRKPIENFYDFAAEFGNCRHEGGVDFRSGKKPEKLIAMLLEYFGEKDEYVLDAFAGSGSTAAVANKMGMRWITIEKKTIAVLTSPLDSKVSAPELTKRVCRNHWGGKAAADSNL